MITELRGLSKPIFRPGVLASLDGRSSLPIHEWLDSRSAGVMGPLTRQVRWCMAFQMDDRVIDR